MPYPALIVYTLSENVRLFCVLSVLERMSGPLSMLLLFEMKGKG